MTSRQIMCLMNSIQLCRWKSKRTKLKRKDFQIRYSFMRKLIKLKYGIFWAIQKLKLSLLLLTKDVWFLTLKEIIQCLHKISSFFLLQFIKIFGESPLFLITEKTMNMFSVTAYLEKDC